MQEPSQFTLHIDCPHASSQKTLTQFHCHELTKP